MLLVILLLSTMNTFITKSLKSKTRKKKTEPYIKQNINKKINGYHINLTKLYANDPSKCKELFNDPFHTKNVSTAVNENRENLLHLAVQFNDPKNIKKFIELNCPVFKQDFYGRTPLHVAIQKEHKECIEEFVLIIRKFLSLQEYDLRQKDLIENFKKMFTVYNHDGYTILHLAVIKNLPNVVEVMLDFCLKFNINILENEVLGSGNSILHLAFNYKFENIAKLIVDKVKGSEKHPNYSGERPGEIFGDEDEEP